MDNQINFAASSSSSSPVSIKKYDVFLSFRGDDTRDNFTSHLHGALIREKVETYIDDRLEKGDEISPALIEAIEASHVSVVIFSENYASSKWCLDEITTILDCKKDHGQVVIPVFYKVDPSHVRNQRGSYKKAFAKHEQDMKKKKDDKLNKWRCALTEAANLSGWDSRTHRNESEFIKDIVKDVLQKLSLRYPIELKGLVGIGENYVQVESLLDIGSGEVRIIGVWGMGGMGKTTLAMALFTKLSCQFEGHCFLEHVREQSEKIGLDALRKKLYELLKVKKLQFDLPQVKSHFVTSKLQRKKVFIVLDDVATSEQLEDLMSDYDCLGPGSRVIVTTRDKHIFSHVDGIYEVKELNNHDSLQIFCLNAFREKHPEKGYEKLSESVIAYCKGNPLALKVLGARLRSRSIEAWKSELRKLQKFQDVKIHNVLKLSFDGLDPTEQDIFLDIACFLKGESTDHVISLLDACGSFAAAGIEDLIDKSLLTISDNNRVEMHDLIQEMGQNVVRQESEKEPGRRSRLWVPEEVYDVLKNNKGTEAVECIILDMSKIKDLYLSFNSFNKMTNIRFLKVYSSKMSEGCKIYLPNGLEFLSDKLRHLEWLGYCLESLPATFCAEMLVKLAMPGSNLQKLWDGVQNLVNLKEIDLRFSKHLVELPDLSFAINLEVLSLHQCKSLCEVHPSILSLHKLGYLYLQGCTSIESLQTDIHLRSLCYLCLSDCSSLKEFSVFSEKLERLWLNGTSIHELPSSIWRSEKLVHVNLSWCDNFQGFGIKSFNDPGMASLYRLNLSGCKLLNESNLCFILDGLQSLSYLFLEKCCNLQSLPDNIGLLLSLRCLYLSGSNVESLSPNIKNLLALEELWLDNCTKLVSLPELPPSLQVLHASNCSQINASNLRLDGLRSLQRLYLQNCCNLQSLPDSIAFLSSLQELDLRRSNVEILGPNMKNLLMLRELWLDNCRKLVSLPALPPSLQVLSASNCSQLDASNLCLDGLWSLRILCLRNCCNLQALPESIVLLPSLQVLDLSRSNVEILSPNIKNILTLEKLLLDNCRKLVSLPKLPKSLRVLSAINCTSLETDFIQFLVHNIPFLYNVGRPEYFFLPRAQVGDYFTFHAEGASITLLHLPPSGMCGFTLCLVLSQLPRNMNYAYVKWSINKHSEGTISGIFWDDQNQNLVSDHVLLHYVDLKGKVDHFDGKIQKSGASDPYIISFEFVHEGVGGNLIMKDIIKSCGVCPIYAALPLNS